MAGGFHPPVEAYLEAIHSLEEEGTPVIQARLAQRLGHSPPTVSETVRRLRNEGYVALAGRCLALTERGRVKAESVVRKHRLAERLLTDVIGLEWHKAHLEAGRWEHVISDEVEDLLDDVLGHPATCPHGNPIPGAGPTGAGQVALAHTGPGDVVRLERVTEEVEADLAALTYLSTEGFVPGAVATVESRSPDGTIGLTTDQSSLAVGASLCRALFVRVLISSPAGSSA